MKTVEKSFTIDSHIEAMRKYRKFRTPEEIQQVLELKQLSENEPIKYIDSGEGSIREIWWFFKGYVYKCPLIYTDDELRLLILEEYDKERRKFERLLNKFETNESKELTRSRPTIPEKVRVEVWRRDGGKCAKCGSRENLEYDHIIPLSKGGSNTSRNIELLCEKCNRSKSNSIS